MLFNTPSSFAVQSGLYDQTNFYKRFVQDLRNARQEVIIESPFISSSRIELLMPVMSHLIKHGVKVYINTRHPDEHDVPHNEVARELIGNLQQLGCIVFYTVRHHRKLAIIDGHILWEGSLNILSNYDTCEVMRRIDSEVEAYTMKRFTGLDKLRAKEL